MRKIREVLRLKFDHKQSDRQIALSCAVSRSSVKDYQERFQRSGLSWPLPSELRDEHLEQALFPAVPERPGAKVIYPDWAEIHQQLRRKGVTRWLLWQEYKSQHPSGIQYSQFCVHYNRWLEQRDPVMRQHQVVPIDFGNDRCRSDAFVQGIAAHHRSPAPTRPNPPPRSAPPHPRRLSLGTARLAAGLYLVRAHAEAGTATRPLTVARQPSAMAPEQKPP